MISQIIIPQQETVDITVSLPTNYIGKKVHCVFYIEEEAKESNVQIYSGKKPSDFFGILTRDEGERFERHVKKIRNEWDRI